MTRLKTILATLAFALGASAAQAAIPASERQVLIDLYNDTAGASWVTNTGWLGAAGTECTWYGVMCDGAEAHVTEVNLDANNLAGPCPRWPD